MWCNSGEQVEKIVIDGKHKFLGRTPVSKDKSWWVIESIERDIMTAFSIAVLQWNKHRPTQDRNIFNSCISCFQHRTSSLVHSKRSFPFYACGFALRFEWTLRQVTLSHKNSQYLKKLIVDEQFVVSSNCPCIWGQVVKYHSQKNWWGLGFGFALYWKVAKSKFFRDILCIDMGYLIWVWVINS